jgi:hypothetical protein
VILFKLTSKFAHVVKIALLTVHYWWKDGFSYYLHWRVKSHFLTYFEVLHTSFFDLKKLYLFSRFHETPIAWALLYLPSIFFLPFPSIKLLCKVDDILIDDFGH